MGWTTPSLDEEEAPLLIVDGPAVLSGDDDGSMLLAVGSHIQSGPDRGLVLHKLLEEVLSRETAGDVLSLTERAEALIRDVGREPTPDPSAGLSPSEIAGCVARALALPEVMSLRSRLVHEFPVYSLKGGRERGAGDEAGVADAVALGPDGEVDAVVDWKSDVAPTPEIVEKYRAQVRACFDALNFGRGLIVFVTTGQVIPVSR